MSLPVTRPMGRALVVGSAACRALPMQTLQRLGFSCAELEDPYTAMIELCRRPLVYHSLVLSLASVYREELAIIGAVKKRFPRVEIWLAQADGRLAALAEAMRLGADGLISDDGLHRTAIAPVPAMPSVPTTANVPDEPVEAPVASRNDNDYDALDEQSNEPVLTADELRALLQEQPSIPPGDD